MREANTVLAEQMIVEELGLFQAWTFRRRFGSDGFCFWSATPKE
jgi:hypothetical protein